MYLSQTVAKEQFVETVINDICVAESFGVELIIDCHADVPSLAHSFTMKTKIQASGEILGSFQLNVTRL